MAHRRGYILFAWRESEERKNKSFLFKTLFEAFAGWAETILCVFYINILYTAKQERELRAQKRREERCMIGCGKQCSYDIKSLHR